MPDKDLTNLPILDDIIMPGDADKAVHNSSSKVQSSLLGNGDSETEDESLTYIQAGTVTEAPEDIQVALEHPVEDLRNIDAVDAGDVSPSAVANVKIPSDAPVETLDEQPATTTPGQDIEALTEQILGNVMPDLEQRIREIIRQTLQQHLPGEIDTR